MKQKTSPFTLHSSSFEVWTSAIKAKSSAGRGGGKKQEFYGIKKLRELILELAVRGLLVPQDPKDEPASVFLKKVEAEKAKLIKDGHIKKPNALPHVSEDEEPFQLPFGWKWVRLNELAAVVRGVTYKKSDASDVEASESVALMRANNIGRGLNFDDLLYIPRKLVSSEQLIIKGDLLIAMSSGSPALVGKAAQANQDLFFAFGAFCAVIRAYSPSLFEYFRIFFDTPFYRKQTQQIGKGIGIQNLNKGELESLLIPVPAASAMKAIVAKVDELMALCDKLEQQQEDSTRTHAAMIETLLGALTAARERGAFTDAWQRIASHFDTLFTTESSIDQLKQTILQLAVMGKLVKQDADDEPVDDLLKRILSERRKLSRTKAIVVHPIASKDGLGYSIPTSWRWSRLEDLLIYGPTNGFSPQAVSYETPVRSLTLSATTSGRFNGEHSKFIATEVESDSNLWLRDGDILVQRGNSIEYVGVAAIYKGKPNCFVYPDLMMKLRVSTALDVEFIHLAMSEQSARGFLRARATGTSGSMPKINQTTLNSLPIALPPLAEQHRIVAKVDELMALCGRLKAHLQNAQATQLHLADSLVGAAIH
jgi:type I restriction enzyme S subunit